MLRNRRGALAALIAASVLAGFAEASILAILAQVASAVVQTNSRLEMSVASLHLRGSSSLFLGIALAMAVVRLALQGVIASVPASIAAENMVRLRRDLLDAFTRASWNMQSRDREGHLQELATNQSYLASVAALQSAGLIVAIATFLVLLASALALNVLAALLVLVSAVALSALLRPLTRLGARQAHELSRTSLDYAGGVNETVRISEDTHVFGVGGPSRARLDGLLARVQPAYFRTQSLSRLVPGVYQSLIYLIVIAALWVVAGTSSGGIASLGAVVLILVRGGTYGQTAQMAYQGMRQGMPYVERLESARHRYLSSVPQTGIRKLVTVGTLAFDRVSFAYQENRAVLSDISFDVAGGDTIGIVGPSGAGKSTLVQLLLALRTATSGRYLINGFPVEEFSRDDWNRQVAYVPQQPQLLHASVADNISFFRNLEHGSILEAAKLAGIHQDIARWPDGYGTVIGPRADAVSGGQEQRICLARALAGSPQVLILDEPTSALDPQSELLIQQSLLAVKEQVTLFIVAHRLSVLEICGRIMVIVNGTLEAFDDVTAVRQRSAYYRSAAELSGDRSAALHLSRER